MNYQYFRKNMITVDTPKGLVELEIANISRISSLNGGAEFHMMNGDSVTSTRTLKKVCESLDAWGIKRVNKQCAVNVMQKIDYDCCRTLTLEVDSKTKKGEKEKIIITLGEEYANAFVKFFKSLFHANF